MNDEVKKYEAVFVVVNRGFCDEVMEAAKSAGARGGTVVEGRGTGLKEAQQFFGVTIEPEKEIVIIVVEENLRKAVMKAVCKKIGIKTKGRAITFSLPITDIAGIVEEE